MALLAAMMLQQAEPVNCYACSTGSDTECASDSFPTGTHTTTAGFNLCVVRVYRFIDQLPTEYFFSIDCSIKWCADSWWLLHV